MISYTSNRAAPMNTIPVGAGALVGPDGGQVAGLVGDAEPGMASPGSMLDAMLADHEARLSQLEDGGA